MTFDSGGLEVLDLQECLSLLAAAPLGRIVFTHSALPAIQPVNFLLHDGDVIIRTNPGSKLAAAAQAIVAFEIDDYDPVDRTGWSVVVVGHARHVTDPYDVAALRELPLETWAPGGRDQFLRIVPAIVTGRRIPAPPSRRAKVPSAGALGL